MANLPYLYPIPGTSIASLTDETGSLVVFYQMPSGNVEEVKQNGSTWTKTELNIKPVSASPLTAILSGGIRLYYLDNNYIIQEYIWTEQTGWSQGDVGKLNVKATPSSGLAVIGYGPMLGDPVVHIDVYYQESGSLAIKQLANFGGVWRTGPSSLNLTGALGGTSLAAVTYFFQNQEQIRVYYQAEDLSLKEHCYNRSGWFPGAFNPGTGAAQTPISALVFGNVELQIYWRDLVGQVIYSTNTGTWNKSVPVPSIAFGYKFNVHQTDNGKRQTLFDQFSNGPVVEYSSNNSGNSWIEGQIV